MFSEGECLPLQEILELRAHALAHSVLVLVEDLFVHGGQLSHVVVVHLDCLSVHGVVFAGISKAILLYKWTNMRA